MSRIKLSNKKCNHTAIILSFIIPAVSSLFIPSNYIQLFASPLCLLIAIYLLQEELLLHLKTFHKEYINKSFYALFIGVGAQVILNLVSSILLKAEDIRSISVVIPVVSVFTVIAAPILEEIIFRHIIYRSLQGSKVRFSILAATISSLLFATMHMTAIGFLGYFAIGMIFCYYYHSTRNIYTTIFAHMMFNFLAVFGTSIHMVFGG